MQSLPPKYYPMTEPDEVSGLLRHLMQPYMQLVIPPRLTRGYCGGKRAPWLARPNDPTVIKTGPGDVWIEPVRYAENLSTLHIYLGDEKGPADLTWISYADIRDISADPWTVDVNKFGVHYAEFNMSHPESVGRIESLLAEIITEAIQDGRQYH